jgi:hypothetical protein
MNGRTGPPALMLDPAILTLDASERHEALVDLFGRYVMWLRSAALESSRGALVDPEAKQRLGLLRWQRYERVAGMTDEQVEGACLFAEATVDRFIELLLTMLAGTGVDQRVGPSLASRFKLDIEIVDVDTEDVVLRETVNRGGRKFFVSYWGRWLNASQASPPSTTDGE